MRGRVAPAVQQAPPVLQVLPVLRGPWRRPARPAPSHPPAPAAQPARQAPACPEGRVARPRPPGLLDLVVPQAQPDRQARGRST